MKRAKNRIYEYYLRTVSNLSDFRDRLIGHCYYDIEKTIDGYPEFENKLEYHKPTDLIGIIIGFNI